MSQIIDTSDVIRVFSDLSTLVDFFPGLYDYHYFQFFVAFTTLEQMHFFPSTLSSLRAEQSI
jgi:hypothetical protein